MSSVDTTGKGDEGRTQSLPLVVIVGAGIAGIAMAIRLKRDYGFDNFTVSLVMRSVLRKTENILIIPDIRESGICWGNVEDLNPNWKNKYPTQPELCAYWDDLWRKYGLESYTKLNSDVSFAEWDTRRQIYVVTVKNRNGVETKVEANIVVFATGGFGEPTYPPGLELDKFKGDLFHAARWKHDVDLKGKTVGVIGNGCSAAQFVPKIAEDPSVKVINFARTPQWYVPQENFTYPSLVKWVFANIPGVMRAYRNWLMFRSDIGYALFRKNDGFLVDQSRKRLATYIRSKAPKEYHEALVPSYAPGCKRLILDAGYLASLNQPNVSLRFDPLDEIVEEGVKLKSGEVVPVDVIIFGTGYNLHPVEVRARGRTGTTIQEYWKEKNGPQAYLGACYPGFPNLYTLLGPNIATGHASVIFSHEAQILHALQLIKPVIDGTAQSFEVTSEATDEYNDWLQKRLSNTVWSDCRSFYNMDVDGKKAKNFATFPGTVTLFWWLCRAPRWDAFRAVGAGEWARQRSLEGYRKWGLWALLLATAIGLTSTVVRV